MNPWIFTLPILIPYEHHRVSDVVSFLCLLLDPLLRILLFVFVFVCFLYVRYLVLFSSLSILFGMFVLYGLLIYILCLFLFYYYTLGCIMLCPLLVFVRSPSSLSVNSSTVGVVGVLVVGGFPWPGLSGPLHMS